jgi:hypothetical protein
MPTKKLGVLLGFECNGLRQKKCCEKWREEWVQRSGNKIFLWEKTRMEETLWLPLGEK